MLLKNRQFNRRWFLCPIKRKQIKRRKKRKRKADIFSILTIIAIIIAFLLGSVFGPALDQMITTYQNWKHEQKYADGLIFVPLDESVYGKGGRSANKAVVAYFDTEIHADNLYVGRTMKRTIEVGNGSNYPTRLVFETEGPVSVRIDEEKANGSEVIIPPHKKGEIPIVITAPNQAFDEPVLTYLKLNQEPVYEENQNVAQQMLPGATIPIYTPRIAPPLKPLPLLSESEFNDLTKDEWKLYELSEGTAYDDLSFSMFDKIKAMFGYLYNLLMFHTYGYLKYILIAVGGISLILLGYLIYRKVGKRHNEKQFVHEFKDSVELK